MSLCFAFFFFSFICNLEIIIVWYPSNRISVRFKWIFLRRVFRPVCGIYEVHIRSVGQYYCLTLQTGFEICKETKDIFFKRLCLKVGSFRCSYSFISRELGVPSWQPTPSILAWRIPGAEGPDGLQSKGLQGMERYWETNTLYWPSLLSVFHWRQ